ncbi:hypothetical protein LG3211_4370 [Lysobacter gummosus]|nr:hypothetical protein LG3211_4370 [Lysobacter gummosus]
MAGACAPALSIRYQLNASADRKAPGCKPLPRKRRWRVDGDHSGQTRLMREMIKFCRVY